MTNTTTSRHECCPECHGSFEIDNDGNFVTHRIAYGGEPCSTDTIPGQPTVSAEVNIPDEAVDIVAGQLLSNPDLDVEREKALMALQDAAPLIVAANPGEPLAPMPDVDQHVADARTVLDLATAAAGLSREAWLIGVAKAHEQMAKAYDLVVERLRLIPESAVFEMAVSARSYHYSKAGELRHEAKWLRGEQS